MKGFAMSVIYALSAGCVSPVDYGAPLADKERLPPLPVFVMDASDAERHPIEAVFVGSVDDDTRRGELTEITVIFADESPSFFGIQTLFLSEPIRRLCYGRWQDVESLRYEYGSAQRNREIRSIVFDGTFACCQGYRALWPRHPSAIIPIGAFKREAGRPVIYVTTWNHLFHWNPRDLADRDVCRIADYKGTRDDVDCLW